MQIIKTINELKWLVRSARASAKTIALVPTMGYFHEGHLSLMRRARAEQDFVIASLFVNPMQFGPCEDYATYPRDIARDSVLAAATKIDVLFTPSVDEIYPEGHDQILTSVEVSRLTATLCGAARPGHFRGVTTVVAKLFNLSEADVAYFGQKDAQQVAVIRRMVDDLNMNVRIVSAPIVREEDGLAMSSRNQYLGVHERIAALVLSRALKAAESLLSSGINNAEYIRQHIEDLIKREPMAELEYVAIVDQTSLTPLQEIKPNTLIALAARFGKTRLIDNLIWK